MSRKESLHTPVPAVRRTETAEGSVHVSADVYRGPNQTVNLWPKAQAKKRFTLPAWTAGALIGLAVCVLLIVLGYTLFAPHPTVVQVSAMSWWREKRLEQVRYVTGTGWRSEAPENVVNWTDCEQRKSGEHDCHPHTHWVGQGKRRRRHTDYERCPTYAEWCSYIAQDWFLVRSLRTSGQGAPAPWPALVAEDGQRTRSRQNYHVVFVGRGVQRWERDVPEDEYRRYHEGQRWRATWSRAGDFTLEGEVDGGL